MADGLFARLPSCTSVCSWLLRACQQVILLYGQITSVMHHAWMHPLVYICSLINGHLCCFMFWLWWIILLSTFMYKFMCGCMSSIFLGTYKRRHIITLRLTSWWAAKLLFLPTAPVYILTSILGGFHFFHLLANIHYGWFFYCTYPSGFKMVFLCGFDSHFPKFQKNIYFCFIDYTKVFDCVDHSKLWKILQEVGIPDHLTCLLRNLCAGQKQRLELDIEQQTGSKLGKECVKAVYCHPAYLTYMQSTSCEMPDWMKHKLGSRLLGEILITLDKQMTPPLWQKARRN